MIFSAPYSFLLVIPLVALFVWKKLCVKQPGLVYSHVSVLKRAPKTLFLRLRTIVSLLPYAALVLFIIALARPQSGREDFRVKTEGIAIMMCIDRSGSMQAIDFRRDDRWVNRLEAVKLTFRDFVLGTTRFVGRPSDLIGLISFGGFVDSVCPLTLDHANLVAMLESIQMAEANKDALGQEIAASFVNEERLTAIGDAIVEAVERIKNVRTKSKVIILLSDGEQTAGIATPLDGAAVAKAFGIKVYTIGIGTTGTAAFVERDPYGKEYIVHQPVTLDQRTLIEVANMTGGRFFNAQDVESLENIYTQIDQLEKSEIEGRAYTKYNEHYRRFLGPGLVMLLLYAICLSTRFRMIPEF